MQKSGLKALGQKIKMYRKQRHLIQAELADIVGISSSYVGSIEQGSRHPSLRVLEKISKTLKIPLSELFN